MTNDCFSLAYIYKPIHPSTTDPLTSYRYYTHMTASAVHLRAKEPAVLSNGVTLNAAKWVPGTASAAHTEQNP